MKKKKYYDAPRINEYFVVVGESILAGSKENQPSIGVSVGGFEDEGTEELDGE